MSVTRHGGCYLKLLSSVRIVGFLLALIFVPVGVGFRHHLFNSIPWDQDDALERGTLMEMDGHRCTASFRAPRSRGRHRRGFGRFLGSKSRGRFLALIFWLGPFRRMSGWFSVSGPMHTFLSQQPGTTTPEAVSKKPGTTTPEAKWPWVHWSSSNCHHKDLSGREGVRLGCSYKGLRSFWSSSTRFFGIQLLD